MPTPQHWDDASPQYKQKLRDWLGEMAFNEFLSYIRPDLSLDVINDWWNWSLSGSRKSLQHILQEFAQMVRDYDPVLWSDEIVPNISMAKSLPPVTAPFVEQTFEEEPYSQFEFHNPQDNGDDEHLFLQITQTPPQYWVTPDSQQEYWQHSQQVFAQYEEEEPSFSPVSQEWYSSGEPEFNIHVTPSQNTYVLRKKRFRPSLESRNLYIRPFRRP